MDGPGFHVEIDRVREAATGITRSVQDQDNATLGDLCGGSEMYGHAGLRDALADFCGRWSDGLDILTEDAGAIGDSLSRVAQAYQAVDEAAAGSFSGDPGEGAVDG